MIHEIRFFFSTHSFVKLVFTNLLVFCQAYLFSSITLHVCTDYVRFQDCKTPRERHPEVPCHSSPLSGTLEYFFNFHCQENDGREGQRDRQFPNREWYGLENRVQKWHINREHLKCECE